MPTSPADTGPRLLAADLGGSKTDLGVYALAAGVRAPLATARLPTGGYDGVAPLARALLDAHGLAVDYASFAVAGPVVDGRAQLTNLPWALEEHALAAALGLKAVWLLNDLAATATAVPHLGPDDLETLHSGEAVAGGTIAVLAPGTGLGAAFLTWDGRRYRAHASEGGHAAFGPATSEETSLYIYARERHGHVSYERVCSGIGLPLLYAYHRDREGPESPAIAARLAAAPEPERARVIIDAALDPAAPDALSVAALETLVAILGTAAASLMLTTLSTGGLYLAGGIAARLVQRLQAGDFLARVRDRGRLSPVIARMPVHVVTAARPALLGAAIHGLERMRAAAPAP
jgi:glucokinase